MTAEEVVTAMKPRQRRMFAKLRDGITLNPGEIKSLLRIGAAEFLHGAVLVPNEAVMATFNAEMRDHTRRGADRGGRV